MGVRLPAEYQEVEYLESTGTQWIDTGVFPRGDLSFDCKFITYDTNAPGYGNVFGSRVGSGVNEYQLTCYLEGTISVGSRNSYKRFYPNTINTVQFDGNNTVIVNGNQSTISTSAGSNTYTIILFGLREGSIVIQLQAGRIYHVEFGDAANLVPCYRKSDSKPGMYDLVSNTFFTNQGTGEFLVGPDVVNHISPRLMDRRRILIAKLTSLFKNIISSETGLVSFNTNFAKPMKITCEFSPKQEGTGDPSPENIRPISAWDGVNINSTKKNLFNKDSIPLASKKYIDSANEGQRYGLTDHENYNVYKIPVKEGIQYTFGKLYANQPNWAFVDDQGIVIHAEANYGGTTGRICTWTAPPGSTALLLSVAVFGQYKFDDTLQVEINSIESDYEYYQGTTIPIPFNNPGTYDFLPIQAGTGDPSPENVRPITPGLTLTRDDNTTLEVWGGSLTVNTDGTGTITSKYYHCVYDGVNKKVNRSYLENGYISAGDVYCYPDGVVTVSSNANNLFSDRLKAVCRYDNLVPYQIEYPGAGSLYLVFRVGLVEGSSVATNAECIAYVNDWLQNNPTSVVYKLLEADYQTYTLSVAETSRAFEALGLGKNFGPLYGGSVTINEDGSVDVVSDYIVAKASEMGGARDISFPTDDVARIAINSYNNYALASTSNKTSKCSILKQGNNYINSSANSYYFYYDLSPSGYTNAESRILALFLDRTPEIEALTTPAEMNAYLDSIGFQIAYQVGNFRPTTYHFSSISELQSFLGANNVWSDLNGPITVEYYNNKKE